MNNTRKNLMRLCALLLALWLLPASSLAFEKGFGEYLKDDVNVREAPGGRILFKKQQGEELYVLAQQQHGGHSWYQVHTYNAQRNQPVTAWVRADMVVPPEQLFTNVRQVAAFGSHIIALRNDGTVVFGGEQHKYASSMSGDLPSTWRDVTQVSAGFLSAFGLKADGSVYSWGIRGPASGMRGIQHDGDLPVVPFTSIHAQDDSFLGLMVDGSLWRLQQGGQHQLLPPGSRVQSFAAWWPYFAEGFAVVDGRVQSLSSRVERGAFSHEQEQVLSGWSDIAQITVGFYLRSEKPGATVEEARPLIAGIRSDATVVALDEQMNAEVKAWTDVQQLAAGDGFLLGLTRDGHVLIAGQRKDKVAAEVAAWRGVVHIAAGFDFCVGVLQDGRLVFAGAPSFHGR